MSCTLMRLAFLIALLCATAEHAGTRDINAGPFCQEYGLLVWGQFSTGGASPQGYQSSCSTTISVNGVTNSPDVNQVTAFSTEFDPVVLAPVDWGSASTLNLSFSPPDQLPIKVWVLYTRSDCDFTCVQYEMSNFLVWANDRLHAERAGIQLIAAGADWITEVSDPAMAGFISFHPPTDCQLVPSGIPSNFRMDNVINLYYVKTVRGLSNWGDACDFSGFGFLGSRVSDGTILHEILHNLWLGHSGPPLDHLNLMWQISDDRRFLSEAQIFRMHFEASSFLNTKLMRHTSVARVCEPNAGPPNKTCPPEDASVWPEK